MPTPAKMRPPLHTEMIETTSPAIIIVDAAGAQIACLDPLRDLDAAALCDAYNEKAAADFDELVADATEAAINAGCKMIQEYLGTRAGDFAAQWFSGGEPLNTLREIFRDYAKREQEITNYDNA